MSFEDYAKYLQSRRLSSQAGKPGSPTDYPSRLRSLEGKLGERIENASSSAIRAFAEAAREDPRLSGMPRTTLRSTITALRTYADFLESTVDQSGLSGEKIATLLVTMGFIEDLRTDKLLRFRRTPLTLYVKRTTAEQPLIVHPAFGAVYSGLAGIPGVSGNERLRFYHNSNLTDFPKRSNRADQIGYGIAFGFTSGPALQAFVGRLAGELDAITDENRGITLRDDLLTKDTESLQLIKARIGQGRFRDDLFELWKGICPISGVSTPELLRASHIKPWKLCNDHERLDPFNGLLLAVHLDALFDRALMSFDDLGNVRIATRLTERERAAFGLIGPLPKLEVQPRHLPYLLHHGQIFSKSDRQ